MVISMAAIPIPKANIKPSSAKVISVLYSEAPLIKGTEPQTNAGTINHATSVQAAASPKFTLEMRVNFDLHTLHLYAVFRSRVSGSWFSALHLGQITVTSLSSLKAGSFSW